VPLRGQIEEKAASAKSRRFSHNPSKRRQSQAPFPPERVAKDLARLLLNALIGIRSLAHSKPEQALLEGVARPALALLDRVAVLACLIRVGKGAIEDGRATARHISRSSKPGLRYSGGHRRFRRPVTSGSRGSICAQPAHETFEQARYRLILRLSRSRRYRFAPPSCCLATPPGRQT